MASTSAQSSSNYFFGWDLLYKTIENSVSKKGDVIIALAHFVLLRQYKMRCVGIGEDKTLTDDEQGTELLPDGWNEDDAVYSLRYEHSRKLYLLFGHKSNNMLLINLLDVETKVVSNICVDPEEIVKSLKGTINQLVPEASHLVDRLRKELVDPVFAGNTKTVTTQTQASPSPPGNRDPLRINQPRRNFRPYGSSAMDVRPLGFPEVGRGDLDPLGGGPPGNLLVFPSRPDLNAGAQPRFDPFGPPEFNMRPPNPDHLPPPNFGDDFYM